jgi:hypothetical protein
MIKQFELIAALGPQVVENAASPSPVSLQILQSGIAGAPIDS